jgi:hypothetical protein
MVQFFKNSDENISDDIEGIQIPSQIMRPPGLFIVCQEKNGQQGGRGIGSTDQD